MLFSTNPPKSILEHHILETQILNSFKHYYLTSNASFSLKKSLPYLPDPSEFAMFLVRATNVTTKRDMEFNQTSLPQFIAHEIRREAKLRPKMTIESILCDCKNERMDTRDCLSVGLRSVLVTTMAKLTHLGIYIICVFVKPDLNCELSCYPLEVISKTLEMIKKVTIAKISTLQIQGYEATQFRSSCSSKFQQIALVKIKPNLSLLPSETQIVASTAEILKSYVITHLDDDIIKSRKTKHGSIKVIKSLVFCSGCFGKYSKKCKICDRKGRTFNSEILNRERY